MWSSLPRVKSGLYLSSRAKLLSLVASNLNMLAIPVILTATLFLFFKLARYIWNNYEAWLFLFNGRDMLLKRARAVSAPLSLYRT